MNLLVFNCGSSSQGFTVFNESGTRIAFGKARNVATKTQAAAVLDWKIDSEKGAIPGEYPTHRAAALDILNLLREKHIPVDAVAHRFVNGGSCFDRAVQVDDDVMDALRDCFPLARLHNPNSYSVIEVCREEMPLIPEYAVFDTAFHSRMPAASSAYAIPQDFAAEKGFRKIGFHGLSYQYVSLRAAALLERPLEKLKLIMCHLGTGGSSVCAMRYGISFDSSMGYSPLSGLVMSTRCGDLDPEIVLDMVRGGMTPDEVSSFLNHKSGLVGLSAYSSNPGEVIAAAESGNQSCKLAIDTYVQRLRHYIGAFLFEMNGADALIFTDDGGVKYPKLRSMACRDAEFSGIRFDEAKNVSYDGVSETLLSFPESAIKVYVIPTDEEATIFEEVQKLLV